MFPAVLGQLGFHDPTGVATDSLWEVGTENNKFSSISKENLFRLMLAVNNISEFTNLVYDPIAPYLSTSRVDAEHHVFENSHSKTTDENMPYF